MLWQNLMLEPTSMEPRFAFTAEYWGSGGVVCRATEGRPGPIVEPQFGEFASWTQALSFARKLNEGLDLDPVDVRQIVTSSNLAAVALLRAGFKSRHPWEGSPVGFAAHDAQIRYMLAALNLARVYCDCSRSLPSELAHLLLRRAQESAIRTRQFMALFRSDYGEMEDISESLANLDTRLQTALVTKSAA